MVEQINPPIGYTVKCTDIVAIHKAVGYSPGGGTIGGTVAQTSSDPPSVTTRIKGLYGSLNVALLRLTLGKGNIPFILSGLQCWFEPSSLRASDGTKGSSTVYDCRRRGQ